MHQWYLIPLVCRHSLLGQEGVQRILGRAVAPLTRTVCCEYASIQSRGSVPNPGVWHTLWTGVHVVSRCIGAVGRFRLWSVGECSKGPRTMVNDDEFLWRRDVREPAWTDPTDPTPAPHAPHAGGPSASHRIDQDAGTEATCDDDRRRMRIFTMISVGGGLTRHGARHRQ